jgi:hypothetical protein
MTPRWRRAITPLKSGIYAAQVVHAASAESHEGAETIKLRLAVLPPLYHDPAWIPHFLVFSPRGNWTVEQFFTSIGIKLPDGTCVSVTPPYCLRRVLYPEIIIGRDLKVVRLLTREEALDKNPRLSAVRLPGNQPDNTLPPILFKNHV